MTIKKLKIQPLCNHFVYDDIILPLREVDSFLIMVPGEAKGEFVKRLERDGIGGRIVGIETVDKMTDCQIAESVRKQFHTQKSNARR